jgi:hypothetical protein
MGLNQTPVRIAGAQDLGRFPQAPAAMSLVTDQTVTDGLDSTPKAIRSRCDQYQG